MSYPGPLIICCNHPNSFLDAIILTTLFKRPVYSLARGDAFKNKFYARILKALHMLPVYRKSEGLENVEHNYRSFEACKEIFKQKGIVLIFSEGLCINEWHLRPLMKGTARLVLSTWDANIPLKVLPTGINYQDFYSFGKNIELNFGTLIGKDDFNLQQGFGKDIHSFNNRLRQQLETLVVEFDSKDTDAIQKHFRVPVPVIKRILLFLPAVLGFLVHALYYYPLKKYIQKKSAGTGHYDSIMVGATFLGYPIYISLLAILVQQLYGFPYGLYTCIAAPFLAWSYVQLKRQF